MTTKWTEDGHFIPPGPAYCWTLRGLSLLAAGLTAALLLVARGQGGALTWLADPTMLSGTPWSDWMGRSIAFPGLLVYGALAVATFGIGAWAPKLVQGAAWRLLLVLAVTAAGAAAWLLIVQICTFEYCTACVGVHLCGILILVLVRRRGPIRLSRSARVADLVKIRRDGTLLLGGLGIALVAALVLGQVQRVLAPLPGPDPDAMLGRGPLTDATTAAQRPAEAPGRPIAGVTQRPDSPAPARPKPPATAPAPVLVPSTLPADSVLAMASPAPRAATAPAATGPSDLSALKTTSPTFDNPQAGHLRSFLGGRVQLNLKDRPILGAPDAPHVLALFVDYTDAEAREMPAFLDAVSRRYGRQVAVLVLPITRDPTYAQFVDGTRGADDEGRQLICLALAVWKAKPEAFALFHNYLLATSPAPSYGAAASRARNLAGTKELDAALGSTWVREQLSRNLTDYLAVQDYIALNPRFPLEDRARLPKLLFSGLVNSGAPAKPEVVLDAIHQHMLIQEAAQAYRQHHWDQMATALEQLEAMKPTLTRESQASVENLRRALNDALAGKGPR